MPACNYAKEVQIHVHIRVTKTTVHILFALRASGPYLLPVSISIVTESIPLLGGGGMEEYSRLVHNRLLLVSKTKHSST